MHVSAVRIHAFVAFLVFTVARTSAAQAPSAEDPAGDLVKQGQQKLRDGNVDAALDVFRNALAQWPDSFQANLQTGVALDLTGNYPEARKHFHKAIQVAGSSEAKTQAERSMAMSYAFERDCDGAAKYESPLHDMYLQARDFFMAGEIANELARVCLESGDLDTAAKWYRTGYETGLKEPGIKPERRDLWEFRKEHALARLAARRGNKSEAEKHVAAAKAILDKGSNPDQAPFYPYLTGYVAFYAGDYKTALAELQQANQRDPFILSLVAQTWEKLGDEAQARQCYERILQLPMHNPPGAFARPLARQKLGQS
jgi:Flp pilus assembly protein TadD